MASPNDVVEGFLNGWRRSNPDGEGPSSSDFLQHLTQEGVDFAAFGEEEWRGMAEEIGLDGPEVAAFLEDVASYME